MQKLFIVTVAFVALALAACAPGAPAPTPSPTFIAMPTAGARPTVPPPGELTLMTHDSFEASESVVKEFETLANVKLKILKSGDAGAALNKAILAKGNPLADVFFGVDNTFLSRALKADIFDAYKPTQSIDLPKEFTLDPDFKLTPVDYGDVCLNYDRAYFTQKNLAPPKTLDDLIKPEYKGLTVVQNPATSSPGLAFLLATVGQFGKDKYIDFWKALRANDVLVTEGWSDAYYAKSTWGGKGGNRPIVVSYATSPAAEVFFSSGKLTEPPTGNVLGDGACFRQIEFAGVLKGAKNVEAARKLIDFMLSKKFQEDIPSQMFVFPVIASTQLPDFFKFAEKPQKPAIVSAADIDANRDAWIKAWTDAVLR